MCTFDQCNGMRSNHTCVVAARSLGGPCDPVQISKSAKYMDLAKAALHAWDKDVFQATVEAARSNVSRVVNYEFASPFAASPSFEAQWRLPATSVGLEYGMADGQPTLDFSDPGVALDIVRSLQALYNLKLASGDLILHSLYRWDNLFWYTRFATSERLRDVNSTALANATVLTAARANYNATTDGTLFVTQAGFQSAFDMFLASSAGKGLQRTLRFQDNQNERTPIGFSMPVLLSWEASMTPERHAEAMSVLQDAVSSMQHGPKLVESLQGGCKKKSWLL